MPNRKSALWSLSLLILLLAANQGMAQIVQGTIIDSEAEAPIAAVEVVLRDSTERPLEQTVTDSLGIFRIQTPHPGTFTLELRHISYSRQITEAFIAERGEVVTIEVELTTQILELEPLVVVEHRRYRNPRLARFYERAAHNRNLGRGRIFFHEELQGLGSIRTLTMMYRGRWNCPLTILVDELPVGDEQDLAFRADLNRVEGVEIYRSVHQIPPEFSHHRACSLMLVWTRPEVGNPPSLRRLLTAVGIVSILLLFGRF